MKNKSRMMPIAITMLVSTVIGIFIGLAAMNFYFIGPHEVHTTEFKPVSYTDFVTILLAAITVLLAIMGIFFAVLAVFGYTTITNRAVDHSVTASETILSSAFKPEGDIHKIIVERINSDQDFRGSVIEAVTRQYIVSISNDENDDLNNNDGNGGDLND